MKNESMKEQWRVILAGAALGLWVLPASADVEIAVEAGLGYSDNVTRATTAPVEETIATAGLDLEVNHDRNRFDAEVALSLDYFHYLDDTYDSEIVGTANADLRFALIPGRFNWRLQDSFGQVVGDPFAPVTPENRENINYISTGPDLLLNVGQAGRLRLFGLYSLTDYERSDLDGDRTLAGVSFLRGLSSASEFGLNAVTETIRYDASDALEYERRSVFLSYQRDAGRTNLTSELGYIWQEPAVGEDSGGALVRISLARELTASSSLSLTLGTQFTDAADALRSSLDGGGGGGLGQQYTAVAEPFENQFASVAWTYVRNRTSLNLGGGIRKDDYETLDLFDRTSTHFDASVVRRISPRLSAGISASLLEDDFDATGFTAEELRVGATLDWQLGRTVFLGLSYDRFDRDGDDSLGTYEENRAFLRLTYRPRSGAAR